MHGASSLRVSLYEFRKGVETIGGNRVVYDLARDEAFFGAASVDGHALVWQLDRNAAEAEGVLLSRDIQLDPFADWIVRCDRIDFPKGGVAYPHTHPGPGIRYLLTGDIAIKSEGRTSFYGPGAAWFENGDEPVYAAASSHIETSFVRVLLLPQEWEGKRTIRYVSAEDEDRPKTQRATVFLEHKLVLR